MYFMGRGWNLQLRRTCSHEEDGLGKEVFAIESPASLGVFCVVEGTEDIGPGLVFATGYTLPGSPSDPFRHAFHVRPRKSKKELAQVPAPDQRLCHSLSPRVS